MTGRPKVLHPGRSKEIDLQSTITAKGQTTIPKAIRDHMRVGPGDWVRFFVRPDGMVVMLPVAPVTKLRGMVKTRRPVTIEEMNEAIAAGAAGEPLDRP